MKLYELNDSDLTNGYYNPDADVHTKRRLGDTRKGTLSLRALNRLKKMRAIHQLEALKREDLLAVMYGSAPDQGGGGGMGGLGF